jgi:hypothetical protein
LKVDFGQNVTEVSHEGMLAYEDDKKNYSGKFAQKTQLTSLETNPQSLRLEYGKSNDYEFQICRRWYFDISYSSLS